MKTIFDNVLLTIAPNLAKEKYEDVLIVTDKLIQKYLISQLKKLVHFDRVEDMDEVELEILKKELHIDYYAVSFSKEEKDIMYKNAYINHFYKGTTLAVEEAANIFYKDAKVEEWYKTNSTPGTFNLKLNGSIKENIFKTVEFIESSKKKSQILSKLIFESENNSIMTTHIYKEQYIKQKIIPAKMDVFIEKIDLKKSISIREIQTVVIGGENGNL